MEKYDIIIIGGGLGGLVAGAKLSKEGKKVLLLEQHSIPGGCATTFKRKGFTVEVGLQAIDGLDPNDPKFEIFKDLSVYQNINFVRPNEFYRFLNKDKDLVIPDNAEKAETVLIKEFPDEKEGIKKFFKQIKAIHDEVYRLPVQRWKSLLLLPLFPVLYPNLTFNIFRSLGNFLDSIITDNNLKLLLQANLLFYGDDPYKMSLIYFSAAQASYFEGGAYYIRGGSQKLSDYLAKLILDYGGEIRYNHKVTSILTERDKAKGVSYEHKNSKQKAMADMVIANTAVPNVVDLLSGGNRKSLVRKISGLKNSCSLLAVYLGFKRKLKDLGNDHYVTAIVNDEVSNLRDVYPNNTGPLKSRDFLFIDYSQIDSDLAPEGKGFGIILAIDNYQEWQDLDKASYKSKKQLVIKTFIERLEKFLPGISEEIEYADIGTSRTIERYTLNPGGSIYGFAQTPEQAGLFRLPQKSPVKNLYFASAWTFPGGGFTGAILSGWYSAKNILDKGIY